MSTKVNLLTPCDPRIFVKFWGNSAQIPGKVFGENFKDIAKRLLNGNATPPTFPRDPFFITFLCF